MSLVAAATLALCTACASASGTGDAPPATGAPMPTPPVVVETHGPVRHDFPYESRTVAVDGRTMHFVEAGTGKPILFVHGNPTWSYLWRHILPALQSRGRVIAVDLVGFGRSEQPAEPLTITQHGEALAAFVEALQLDDVLIVGHDWGSHLALQWAARHPDDVRGVVLMEAALPSEPGDPDIPPAWREHMGELRELFLRTGAVTESRKLVIDENAYIEELLPLSIVRELTPDELDAYREPFTDPAARQAILRLRLSVGSVESRAIAADSLAWLNVTETPVLLLTATPGVIGTDRQVAWVRKTLPRVEIADIGEGLHLVQEDRPDEIAAAILEWMDAHDL